MSNIQNDSKTSEKFKYNETQLIDSFESSLFQTKEMEITIDDIKIPNLAQIMLIIEDRKKEYRGWDKGKLHSIHYNQIREKYGTIQSDFFESGGLVNQHDFKNFDHSIGIYSDPKDIRLQLDIYSTWLTIDRLLNFGYQDIMKSIQKIRIQWKSDYFLELHSFDSSLWNWKNKNKDDWEKSCEDRMKRLEDCQEVIDSTDDFDLIKKALENTFLYICNEEDVVTLFKNKFNFVYYQESDEQYRDDIIDSYIHESIELEVVHNQMNQYLLEWSLKTLKTIQHRSSIHASFGDRFHPYPNEPLINIEATRKAYYDYSS